MSTPITLISNGQEGIPGLSDQQPNNPDIPCFTRDQAAIKIQTVYRGYIARNRYIKLKEMNIEESLRNYDRIINQYSKFIVRAQSTLQHDWEHHFLTQEGFEQKIIDLQKINFLFRQVKNDVERVRRTKQRYKVRYETFTLDCNQIFAGIHKRLNQLCKTIGFKSLVGGLQQLLGEIWELEFSGTVASRIKEFNQVFVPTAYEITNISDVNSQLFTYVDSKNHLYLPKSKENFEKERPFFTRNKLKNYQTALEFRNGLELNIPVTLNNEKKVIIFKGYLKEDCAGVLENILGLKEKRINVLNHLDASIVPEWFKEKYVCQMPLMKLLLKTPSEIERDITKAWQMLKNFRMIPTVALIEEISAMSLEEQIESLAILLMDDLKKKSLAIFDNLQKDNSDFKDFVRKSLHHTLQEKLALEQLCANELKEQMKKINAEDITYEQQIQMSQMDLKTKMKALSKAKETRFRSSDSSKAEKYLEGILKVPFGVYTSEAVTKNSTAQEKQLYLNKVSETLEKAVHGHTRAKRALLRWVAQRIENEESKGECFALEGPPGNGKTTLAKLGVSKALNRPFAFIPLGGATDASYFSGHGYTWLGSEWGRIVDILIETKCMDPIIYFDEVDKISQDAHGKQIIGLLIALTDPSQNSEFHDKYFAGIDFDLSRALFIFSYNDPSKIDPVLRDRMTKIKTHRLSQNEKLVIAQKHLMPEILKSTGFKEGEVLIHEDMVHYIIENYTYEAGVRRLKENLFAIVRELNLKRIEDPNSIKLPYTIDIETIHRCLEEPKVEFKKILPHPIIGTVSGLYANATGLGGLSVIQAYKTVANNHLELNLTGSQGVVMQESMKVAKTVAWNLLTDEARDKILSGQPQGLHIHAPEGSTPKDGPSAGGAITTAIISQLIGIPVRNDVATTGEIDLTGKISKIGGLSAKLMGAKRAGVKLAIIPKDNEKDLEKLKEEFKDLIDDTFKVVMVEDIYELLDYVLVEKPKLRPKH